MHQYSLRKIAISLGQIIDHVLDSTALDFYPFQQRESLAPKFDCTRIDLHAEQIGISDRFQSSQIAPGAASQLDDARIQRQVFQQCRGDHIRHLVQIQEKFWSTNAF